jgi:A/G-specific adenine glycosylase
MVLGGAVTTMALVCGSAQILVALSADGAAPAAPPVLAVTPVNCSLSLGAIFSALAYQLLEKKQPGVYNQSLMDFGAVVCKPQLPLCFECPLKTRCIAYINKSIEKLPYKEKAIQKQIRWLNYLVIEQAGSFYIKKRTSGDIWENLYEFVLLETTKDLTEAALKKLPVVKELFGNHPYQVIHTSKIYQQRLTHRLIKGRFLEIKISHPFKLNGYIKVTEKSLIKFPFPKFTSNYLKDKNVSLKLI